jgi:hypothetical protein
MTEEQARQVLWVLTRESAAPGPAVPWTADDRAWATREALAALGEPAAPDAFVTTRARLALSRLLPRDEAGQRFLARRFWHPAWVLLAMAAGLLAGLLVDQLGPPLRVNLLAPAVWAVVAWNLVVYLLLLWPRRAGRGKEPAADKAQHQGKNTGLTHWLGAWAAGSQSSESATQAWLRHAAPLSAQRVLVLLHSAAAMLALGLIAGLYLRGLVLDYRAGWQSTFLAPGMVQALLDTLLAPAAALTGVPVADVAPLRLLPGAEASASAAPWIHLYAATLGLFVVLPRLLLAAWAAGRAQRLAARFPLPLNLPGLRSLHPLMRPGPARPLRLLWAAPTGLAPVQLLAAEVSGMTGAARLWQTEDGDALDLVPLPAALPLHAPPAPSLAPAPAPWWQRVARLWRGPDLAAAALRGLHDDVDAVLLVADPLAPRPTWLADLARPVLVLADAEEALAPALPLRRLADGWLPGGALLQALRGALPDDDRLQALSSAWQARQAQQLEAHAALLAQSLARLAVMRVAVPDEGLLSRKDDGASARDELAHQTLGELQATTATLAASLGRAGASPDTPALQAQPTVVGRVGEGRAAVLGGVLSGALTGLKADLLTGGLTLGAGAVAGGVVGALGAAGVARGLNAARGAAQSHAAWSDDTLASLAQALLLPYLQLAHGLTPEAASARLRPTVAAQLPDLRAAWQQRPDQAALVRAATPVLQRCVRQALGGP